MVLERFADLDIVGLENRLLAAHLCRLVVGMGVPGFERVIGREFDDQTVLAVFSDEVLVTKVPRNVRDQEAQFAVALLEFDLVPGFDSAAEGGEYRHVVSRSAG